MSGKQDHPWPPRYFEREGGRYMPNGLAKSPWDRTAIAGGPLGGLLAHGAEIPELDDEFEVARFNLEIFGRVPHGPLEMRTTPVHGGRSTRLHRVEILADGKIHAQAHVLRVRRLESPAAPAPMDYPLPDTLPEAAWLERVTLGGALHQKPISGKPGKPGRGLGWLSFEAQIIGGVTPSPFVKACYFADFGSGIGSATDRDEWTHANLDIAINFLRMPEGEWQLVDAETHMSGNGKGVAINTFADVNGVYARGLQTVFIAPAPSRKPAANAINQPEVSVP